MKSIFIIHFQPIEKYPPIVNLIRFITRQPNYQNNLCVITTHPGVHKTILDIHGVKIERLIKWKKRSRWGRLYFYLAFNLKSSWELFKKRPDRVLYYETLSAFSPWFYKKWINKKARIFIHYHEYTSPVEYVNGMVLNRWLHEKEKQLYPLAEWISHTNSDRMDFFLRDIGNSVLKHTAILPNYPPAAWKQKAVAIKRDTDERIGFVYVGALSMRSMYTSQMAELVARHSDKCYWHIYSDNYDPEVKSFLEALNASNIVFKDPILYDDLPLTLPKYDIGVILYNGDTPNYAYNAPNKFYEYLVCGLNVWFGKGMKGMYVYEQQKMKPWVQCVDFYHLSLPYRVDAYRIEQLPEQGYTAEMVYKKFWDRLVESRLS